MSPHATLCLLPADATLPIEAERLLTPSERVVAAGYTFPKRQRDWLLGRLAAKRALHEASGGLVAPEAFEIRSGERGRPGFAAPTPLLAGWDLSITHGHGRAAALVAPAPIGVDLEAIRGLEPRAWRFFLGEDERQWVADGGAGPQGEILCWALKEAVYKALENRATQVLDLRVLAAGAGQAELAFGEERWIARYVRLEDFFLAIATSAMHRQSGWWAGLALPAALEASGPVV